MSLTSWVLVFPDQKLHRSQMFAADVSAKISTRDMALLSARMTAAVVVIVVIEIHFYLFVEQVSLHPRLPQEAHFPAKQRLLPFPKPACCFPRGCYAPSDASDIAKIFCGPPRRSRQYLRNPPKNSQSTASPTAEGLPCRCSSA